jgi:hypothetical protein
MHCPKSMLSQIQNFLRAHFRVHASPSQIFVQLLGLTRQILSFWHRKPFTGQDHPPPLLKKATIMHLPELAVVGTIGFARLIKGWRDCILTSKKQARIRLDTATSQAGWMQHQSKQPIASPMTPADGRQT